MKVVRLIILLYVGIFCTKVNAQFNLVKIAGGLSIPVDIRHSNVSTDDRLFIVEKTGKIKILMPNGSVISTPFLDIDNKVNSASNERGLLGLCFDPEYKTNGYFYVNYSNNSGNTVVSRFKVDGTNPNIADPNSEKIIITVSQPFNNHNGGNLAFGPDGYLYIGLGDGGAGGDPGNRSQNTKELLGKMLRIDVKTETEKYLIPADNPFTNRKDTLPEIWSIGLRNPWRYSFDRLTGDLWIGDVGQDKWEEINMEGPGKGGLNYGWRCYEGFAGFNINGCGNKSNYQEPIFAYAHGGNTGCSITGGFVYRGTKNNTLKGKYVYVDYCTGIFYALNQNADLKWENTKLIDLRDEDFSSFGEDYNGELYVAGAASGNIYKVEDGTSTTTELSRPNHELKILQNPVSSILQWTVKSSYVGDITWTLIHSNGEIIRTLKLTKISEEQSFSTNVDQLKIGTYFLQADISIIPSGTFVKF